MLSHIYCFDALSVNLSSALQHYAARNGHCGVCRLLLEAGASVDAQTRSGEVTPLHRASYSGHINIVSLLIQHGASVCHSDTDGKTPLHKVRQIMKMLYCLKLNW